MLLAWNTLVSVYVGVNTSCLKGKPSSICVGGCKCFLPESLVFAWVGVYASCLKGKRSGICVGGCKCFLLETIEYMCGWVYMLLAWKGNNLISVWVGANASCLKQSQQRLPPSAPQHIPHLRCFDHLLQFWPQTSWTSVNLFINQQMEGGAHTYT